MNITHRRGGISTAAGIAAVVVAIVLIVAAYEVITVSSATTTATIFSPTTSTSTSTVVGPVTTTTATITGPVTTTTVTGPTSTATSTSTATVTTISTSFALNPLISYSADAYATETTSLLAGFSKSTGIPVAPVTSGGSTADAAAIAAGAPDDVFVSASLSATSPSNLLTLSSNWAIGFATDQMVLAYANSTTQTAATNNIVALANTAIKSNATSDWNAFYSAVVGGTVKVGISAPSSDPAGARSWILLQLAGYLYSGGNSQAYVSALLADKANVTASSAANLVAPLQAGNIQFLFTYRSAAIGNELNFITLNNHVNLGTASLSSFYAKYSYTTSAGVTKGGTIVICVTIPLSAVNTSEAIQFVQYLVQNAKSLASFGLVPLTPCLLYSSSPPPAAIQALVTAGLITNNGALP